MLHASFDSCGDALAELKESTSLFFRPYAPLSNYQGLLHNIDTLVLYHQYEAALEAIQDLIRHALSGLHYFQTYDWLFLMTVISLGYVGWMVYVGLHVVENYTSLLQFGRGKHLGEKMIAKQRVSAHQGHFLCCILDFCCNILMHESFHNVWYNGRSGLEELC